MNGDKPFRLHATEIGSHMATKRAFRVEHDRSVRPSPKNHPMPEGASTLFVPFDGEQRTIRQGLPGSEGHFRSCRPESIFLEQPENVVRLGP